MEERQQVATKISFRQAIKDYFQGYFDIKGTTTRAGFWKAVLFMALVAVVLVVALFFVMIQLWIEASRSGGGDTNPITIAILIILFYGVPLAMLIPMFTMGIRRFRDAGINQKVSITFVVGLIIVLVVNLFVGNAFIGFISTEMFSGLYMFIKMLFSFISIVGILTFFGLAMLPQKDKTEDELK